MHSGFTGGGPSEFYTASRSIAGAVTNPPQQNPYRSQVSGIFVDPSTQIARQTPTTLMGKRTLAEFQSHQQNQAINNLLLRSVRPRASISPVSPVDFSTMSLPSSSEFHSHRLHSSGAGPTTAPLHPLGRQTFLLGNGIGGNVAMLPSHSALQGVPHMVSVENVQESEKKIINHRLQELEKHLLEDNDEDDGVDAVSVITSTNSEWSETIQNLISPSESQKPTSASPTSSTSSSSSSTSSPSSVASLASGSWRQSVMDAASAISEGKLEIVTEMFTRFTQLSPPKGNSEQRLMDYMVSALKSRLNPTEYPPPVAELFSAEHASSTHLLYDLSTCFKLGFMAANLAILEATVQDDQANCNKLHVVDFDIGQGGQYMNLLHALSVCKDRKPVIVKLTTLTENGGEERVKNVGESLSQLAKQVGVSFKFNVVSQKLGELTRETLGCEADESLAVNFAFKLYRMPDESVSTENPRDELLRRIKGMTPRVVTLVEQEMNTNTAPLTSRVAETCTYYAALFDSIESTVLKEKYSDRVKVEELLGRNLANSIACEGRDRIERCEVFGKWRARMGMAGFELKSLSQKVAESLKTRLGSGNRVHPGFTVKEENGGVCFGWIGRTLTVASAWR